MLESSPKLLLLVQEVLKTWQEFCGLHSKLYELTCDEYMHLLSSDLDALEKTINLKEEVIKEVNQLDLYRRDLLNDLDLEVPDRNLSSIGGLLKLLNEFENKSFATHLEKYNLLLVDIIKSIQDQNKKNQLFLNRALISLNDLRDRFKGPKNYKTYTNKGTTSTIRG